MATEIIELSWQETETRNKSTMTSFYKALATGNTQIVAGLPTSDLEWWFHGPQNCHHMMKILTGNEQVGSKFRFEPRTIEAIDDRVIAEGWEGAQAYWVHVWTLKDGFITQFREYFNTWVTVTELRPVAGHDGLKLWQSQPRDLVNRSLPGLLLAI
ncbi:wound-induced protein 1 [Impatiens glandulifera]|uniref:wound-induced protein 1 n=1 Tax=Impatiens glandulifera TaxID=253017 RepID=UPI001FB0ABBD|nr:wound-induced protein 1 [Impatiens glandulifera]